VSSSAPLRPSELLRAAARLGVRSPFITILALSLFVSYVSATLSLNEDGSIVASVVLWVVLAYLQMATILAAASGAPGAAPQALLPDGGNPASADTWLREAFKRRCFLRFFATDVFSLMLVLIASVAFLVPGFIAGAMVGVAPMSAVLGFERPTDAIRRAMDLSKPARRAVGVVFGSMILVPFLAYQVTLSVAGEDLGAPVKVILPLLVVVTNHVGVIALTKAYVALGGTTLPRSARPDPGAPPPH
jgi:hypothetical protein